MQLISLESFGNTFQWKVVLFKGKLFNFKLQRIQTDACNGRQEIAKAIIANFIFPWFLRLLFLVTFLCILGVATSYQDATIRKSYNYGTWSSGLRFGTRNIKSLTLHAVITLILLPFAAPNWYRFYLVLGLAGLCYIKNPNWWKRSGFNIYKIIKKIYISFDMDYVSVSGSCGHGTMFY